MKKLHGGSNGGGGGSSGRRGKVHPSPTPAPTNPDHYLSLLAVLPAAILALTAALSAEDREVLAYLVSSGGERRAHPEEGERAAAAAARRRRAGGAGAEGPPQAPAFGCSCFHCYTSYWARWDASPNRQLIHEIIDALEEENLRAASGKRGRPARRGRAAGGGAAGGGRSGGGGAVEVEVVGVDRGMDGGHVADVEGGERDEEEEDGEGEEEEEMMVEDGVEKKSSVRRLVNYLGERLWGVWSL